MRTYILGIFLGIVTPIIGLFAGLQISTTLGNILAFPLLVVSYVSSVPIGMWPWPLWVIGAVLSIALWTSIVGLYKAIFK